MILVVHYGWREAGDELFKDLRGGIVPSLAMKRYWAATEMG